MSDDKSREYPGTKRSHSRYYEFLFNGTPSDYFAVFSVAALKNVQRKTVRENLRRVSSSFFKYARCSRLLNIHARLKLSALYKRTAGILAYVVVDVFVLAVFFSFFFENIAQQTRNIRKLNDKND